MTNLRGEERDGVQKRHGWREKERGLKVRGTERERERCYSRYLLRRQ